MNLSVDSKKLFPIFLLFGAGAGLMSCGTQLNPYVGDLNTQASPDSSTGSQIVESETHSSPSDGSTSTANSSTNPSASNSGASGSTSSSTTSNLSLADLYNAACKAIKGIKLESNVTEELAVFCKGEVATGKFTEIIGLAYDGNGEPKTHKPLKLVSKGNETELMITSSTKIPLSIKSIQAVGEKKYNYTVTGNGTTLTNSVVQKLSQEGDHVIESYLTKGVVSSKVMLITMNDTTIGKSISLDLGHPQLSFVYEFLAPGRPENTDNRIGSRVTFYFQAQDALTYAFVVSHVTVNNKGIASVAEEKIVEEPPLITKKIFSILVGK